MNISPRKYQLYLSALLAGREADCYRLVEELLAGDVGIRELYLDLFQRSLYEVGRLWETNLVSVAVEHVATAITESLLSLVYPRLFGAVHSGRRAVVSCLANEYHQIGGRMVADIFELHGWDGYFLGANLPLAQLCAAIDQHQPDLLALSLSVAFNFDQLYKAIDEVRGRYPALPILVGGQAFLWGGSDIGQRYPGVRQVAGLADLEAIIEAGPL